MQLTPGTDSRLGSRLRAAATLALAAVPGMAHAGAPADTTHSLHFEGSGLIYGESQRVSVVEPVGRLTKRFANGQTLSATVGFDVITGATPTGELPSGKTVTTTGSSGQVKTSVGDQLPVAQFKDLRSSIDADYGMPVGRLVTATVGGHLSHEKDYDSRGVNGSVAVDLLQRLFTVTVGGSRNHDTSSPIGGTHVPLTDGSTLLSTSPQAKDVNSLMFGLSHVMTRRWLLGVSWSRTWEHGALTEPYKVLSVVDGEGTPVSILTEKRPDSRARRSIQVNSVQNIAGDVTRVSYRDYRDDWGVHSGTFDLEYRHDLDEKSWFEPHVRYYKQTAASFFTWGMVEGHRLPAYASSDYRLGPLRTLTLGATYGFHLFDDPGSMYVRAEYISQYGDGKPSGAIGIQQQYDLFPKLDIGSVVVGYAIDF